jgi:hypothetical protein
MGSESLVKPLHKAYGAGLEFPGVHGSPGSHGHRLILWERNRLWSLSERSPTPSASPEEVEFTITLIF